VTRARDVADTQENLGGAVPPFTAGKNKIINGDFGIWQRGTTLTYTNAALNYLPDRFFSWVSGTQNVTISQQTFTPGTAPVAGYEGQYFMRNTVTSVSGQSIQAVGQRIEDARTLAGQTATFSFWAKADASRTYTTRFIQNFGSGGSSEVGISGGSHSVTTSWQRFTVTVSIPSVSGKTIGTSSYLQPLVDGPANTANVLDTWGWQLEAGSTATPFQTATGTLQGELAACQRYFNRLVSGAQRSIGIAAAYSTTSSEQSIPLLVEMRTAPSLTLSSASHFGIAGVALSTTISLNSLRTTSKIIGFDQTIGSAALVARGAYVLCSDSASATFDLSAEL
jgi:hypothetical protein